MPRFTVILSDSTTAGRGVRGRSLVQFLKVFAGQRNVRVYHPRQIQSRRFYDSDYLFIGVPTHLSADQSSRLRAKQTILFDYDDLPETQWGHSDTSFLRSLTDQYFKPCFESHWDSRWQWGCLPLRRGWKLNHYLMRENLLERFRARRVPEKDTDVGFLGCPTCLRLTGPNGLRSYPQRIEWLTELVRQTNYSWWGGFSVDSKWRGYLENRFGDLSDLCFDTRRLAFRKYFAKLRACRAVLTPSGNARWTYRHYEAVYTRSILVSTDLRETSLLIPLPKHSIVMVGDHEPLGPAIETALKQFADEPECVLESQRELEQFFLHGNYHRKRPLAWQRFDSQLNPIVSPTLSKLPAEHVFESAKRRAA